MSTVPPPWLRRAVGLTKPVLVGAVAFVTVSAAVAGHAGTTTYAGEVTVAQGAAAPAGQARLDRLLRLHDCSPTGYGADVIPGSALVLRDGEVRHVSFDDGWATHTGDRPGALLAVCRGPL